MFGSMTTTPTPKYIGLANVVGASPASFHDAVVGCTGSVVGSQLHSAEVIVLERRRRRVMSDLVCQILQMATNVKFKIPNSAGRRYIRSIRTRYWHDAEKRVFQGLMNPKACIQQLRLDILDENNSSL